MNLQRVRVRLTLIYGLLSALAVGAIAWYAVRVGSDRIYESAEREAVAVATEWAVATEEVELANTWLVNPVDEWTDPQGDAWVEPPLFTIASNAGGHPSFGRFEQDGRWLSYTQPVDGQNVIVTAVELGSFDSDVSSLRLRVWVVAIGLVAAASAAGYWIAGRSLRPTRAVIAQQRDFIADASHELRTPLAVIQASASHTLSRHREADEYRESLSEILEAAEKAGQSVGELLELARLDAGQAEPRRAPLRLDLLVEEVASTVRIDGVTIEAVPGEAVVVEADYPLIRQVVENLTRNAAARADHIHLTCTPWEGWAVVQVGDNGPGFDPEVLPHVFDRFRRGDSRGSSGLGLAIAKSLVEAHDGVIDALNGPEGGALLRVRLPLSEM